MVQLGAIAGISDHASCRPNRRRMTGESQHVDQFMHRRLHFWCCAGVPVNAATAGCPHLDHDFCDRKRDLGVACFRHDDWPDRE